VASAEGIICVEKIAGVEVKPLDYKNIPGCTYTTPEIASCGLTEAAAREAGYDIKVGKFPLQPRVKQVLQVPKMVLSNLFLMQPMENFLVLI